MDILYIAPYRQADTWGEASRAYLSSLLLTDHNIITRPIFFNTHQCPIDDQIKQLENKTPTSHDILIEKGLPFGLEYNGHFKRSIGIYSAESNCLWHTSWPTSLNLMDELWVATDDQIQTLQLNNVTQPAITTIPEPIDTTVLAQPHPPLPIPDTNDTFNFYFMGDLSDRDNLLAVLIAFHTAFNINSSVNLILYIHAPQQDVDKFLSNVKTTLRIYPQLSHYKHEICIAKPLSFQERCQLHSTAHCLVAPTRSPNVARDTLYAMGLGNIILCGKSSGIAHRIPSNLQDLLCVQDQSEIAYCTNPPLPYLYSGYEQWHNINTAHLRLRMQQIYELYRTDKAAYHTHSNQLQTHIKTTLSYQNIANTINGVLT